MTLLSDGTAKAWGDINYVFEESPIPGNAAVPSPTPMPWVTGATDIATSAFLSCFIQADHTVACWDTLRPDYVVRMQ